MVKYVLYSIVVIGFPVLLQRVFPSDNEHGLSFTLGVFFVILLWALFGVFIFLKKYAIPHYVYVISVLLVMLVMYNIFPWYRNYTGSQIVKDSLSKRENTDSVNLEWLYSLSPNIENYPLIELAQKRFKQLDADKNYLVNCYYYNSAGVEQYVMRCMIYFKNGTPFTIGRGVEFEQKNTGEYELTYVPDSNHVVRIQVKDGRFDLNAAGFKSQIDPVDDIEIYRKEFGKYILDIKKQNKLNVFNVSKNYWVYKIL